MPKLLISRRSRVLAGAFALSLFCIHAPLLAQTAAPTTELATTAPHPDLPNAPSETLYIPDLENSTSTSLQPPQQQTPAPPSLGDLGLTPAETEGNAKQQAIFDRRTYMLKMHQRLGLITVIPVAAACISAIGAPPEHGQYGNTTSRDIHVALGGVAVCHVRA